MLPRARRLTRQDVERLMKAGRQANAGALRVRYGPSPSAQARFAFVVSKRVAKDAVIRNRLRRWGAAAARTLSSRKAVDMAITVTRRYDSAEEFARDLSALFQRLL